MLVSGIIPSMIEWMDNAMVSKMEARGFSCFHPQVIILNTFDLRLESLNWCIVKVPKNYFAQDWRYTIQLCVRSEGERRLGVEA